MPRVLDRDSVLESVDRISKLKNCDSHVTNYFCLISFHLHTQQNLLCMLLTWCQEFYQLSSSAMLKVVWLLLGWVLQMVRVVSAILGRRPQWPVGAASIQRWGEEWHGYWAEILAARALRNWVGLPALDYVFCIWFTINSRHVNPKPIGSTAERFLF